MLAEGRANTMKKIIAAAVCLSMVLPAPVHASWLSKITGVHVNLNGGPVVRIEAPQPQAIPEMLQNLPKDAAQFFLSPQGTALAAAIRHARGQVRPSASPVPPQIRQALAPYFPANILDKVRWASRNNLSWTLDTAVMKLSDPDAITLDDVIVFNGNINPQALDLHTLELWAHELTHVLQYENMGVESFAFIYSYDWGKLEGQAKSNASQVRVRLAQGAPVQNYYSVGYASAAQIGSRQLAQPVLQQQAMRFVPPARCVAWQTNMGGAVVQNICSVPIAVQGWTQIDPWTNSPVGTPCMSNCALAPGAVNQFLSPRPGIWVDIGFAYYR